MNVTIVEVKQKEDVVVEVDYEEIEVTVQPIEVAVEVEKVKQKEDVVVEVNYEEIKVTVQPIEVVVEAAIPVKVFQEFDVLDGGTWL